MSTARRTFYTRFGKRCLDLTLAVVALILLSPLLVFLAILVRFVLGAPILFRQQRSGYGKKLFTILKFRTMTDETDANGTILPDSQRLTRLGRFLRGTSLDELPELLNVLKGEMSLIGPRPLLPEYDPYYSDREAMRFELLPGLTGWAQINGRNDLAWDGRLECDAFYAENCSLWLDLKILFLTVIKVVRRENVEVDPDKSVAALDQERRAAMRSIATNHDLESSCKTLPAEAPTAHAG